MSAERQQNPGGAERQLSKKGKEVILGMDASRGGNAGIPKGYKWTEVGMIPEDWNLTRLGAIANIATGNTPPTINPKNYGDEYPFVSPSDIGEAKYITNTEKNLSKKGFAISRSFPKDSILFVSIGSTIGKCGIAPIELTSNQQINAVFPSPNFSVGFLYYAICFAAPRIKALAGAQAVPIVNKTQFSETYIPLASLPEQRAIAEALSDVDGLLGALEALIAKKRAIKQAAMQQLLTGKTRLPGFSGGWRRVFFGDHVTYLRNGAYSRAELMGEGSIKYLHYGDIHTSNEVRLDPQKTAMPILPDERAITLDRLCNGDLVFVDASEDLDGIGKSLEIYGISDAQVVAGLHTIAARFDKSVIADGFKAYLQFCPAFRDQLKRLAAGTKVFATNRTHISSAKILLPDTEEQTAIATVLSDMDAEIAALERRRDKTRAIKQGMIQQLLTGRIRLVEPKAKEAP
jgi:type I restriction enzyme S subunit